MKTEPDSTPVGEAVEMPPAAKPLARGLPFIRPKGSEALLFSARAATAAVIAYYSYFLLKWPGIVWAPVSAVIVMQPTLKTSVRASLVRLGANLAGAVSGAVVGGLFGLNPLALALGVLLTGLICHYGHLDEGLNRAHAAVAIVLLTSGGSSVWIDSLERVVAVMFGCTVALGVSLAFDRAFRRKSGPCGQADGPE